MASNRVAREVVISFEIGPTTFVSPWQRARSGVCVAVPNQPFLQTRETDKQKWWFKLTCFVQPRLSSLAVLNIKSRLLTLQAVTGSLCHIDSTCSHTTNLINQSLLIRKYGCRLSYSVRFLASCIYMAWIVFYRNQLITLRHASFIYYFISSFSFIYILQPPELCVS